MGEHKLVDMYVGGTDKKIFGMIGVLGKTNTISV